MPSRFPPLVAHVIFRLDLGGLENSLVNLINGTPLDHYRHAVICLTDFTDFRQRLRRPDVVVYDAGERRMMGEAAKRRWRAYFDIDRTLVELPAIYLRLLHAETDQNAKLSVPRERSQE